MASKTKTVFKRTHVSSSAEIQELDREDGEERITDANRDRKRHDVRREAENTSRHQTAPNKGSACAKMRSSRAAPLCLVLLCGGLLTAVIVLAFDLHNMIEDFHIKNKNITNEISRLSNEKYNLLTNIDKLQKGNENLEKEKTTMQDYIKKMKSQLKEKKDGWTCYQSSLYYMSSETKSWTESRKYCKERGADLIIINNREEQEAVQKILGNSVMWIGLNDTVVEDTWKWVDGSKLTSDLITFWKNQRPKKGTNNEDCAGADSSGWADYPCDQAFKWICEKS